MITTEAATLLGLTRQHVRRIARARKLGALHGRDWLFTESDLTAMKVRRPAGWPRKVERA